MMEGRGKFHVRKVRKGVRGETLIATIYVSATLVKDSQWPFRHKDALHVTVDPKNKRIIISKE